MATERLAPAKVNLFLHVGPLEPSGYHPICSLMAFGDIGDRLTLTPSHEMAFEVAGPFADELGGDDDNLVPHARDRLIEAIGVTPSPFRLTLDKQLPIAAGLGGGSADAAASLSLVAEVLASSRRGATRRIDIGGVARGLGADVPACLDSQSVIAEGRGDRLTLAPAMPPLDVVLVNPGAPSSTRAVYRAFDAGGDGARADRPRLPPSFRSTSEVADFLHGCRNDLQTPAIALQPLIGPVLTVLQGERKTLLARMTGSGATCFSLCASSLDARRMANRLAAAHPAWWVRACRLGAADNSEADAARDRSVFFTNP